MNLNETKAILKEVALLDNRKLDEAIALAWHAVIGYMSFEVAKSALVLARQDASINYLEPKHLVQWGKEAAHRLNRNQQLDNVPVVHVVPEPTCKAHNVLVTSCRPCCKAMAEMADSLNMFEAPSKANNFTDFMFKGTPKLNAWAKENIYA